MAVSSTSVSKKKTVARRKKVTYTSSAISRDLPLILKEAAVEYRAGRIKKAGIDLVYKKDVPYFYADPKNPSRLIRVLNRKKEPVIFCKEKGDFVVCK